MTDPRVQKLARLLIRYSLNVKKGQVLLINSPAVAAPLVREAYREAILAGAYVETAIALDGLDEIFYKHANEDQLTHVSTFRKFRTEKMDAMLGIWADVNTRSFTNADSARMAKAAAASKGISKIFLDRFARGEMHWVGTQWPTYANAQDAEMSLSEYEDFVFAAGHLDDADPVATWKAVGKSQKALQTTLNRCSEVRVVAADTDITLSVKGRKWVNCDGHENFPDGEVFTGPVEHAVNGHIRFSFPAVHHGREVQNVFLEFRQGKCVTARADKGEDFLRAMIDMDKGSSFLGELAFGVNYNITRYTRNTLFDEKIGGTVHLALGAGYPETGSVNESGLHWDMVCDLRQAGKVFADGKLLLENGRFGDKRFAQPAR